MLREIDCPSIIRQKLYFWNASLDYKSEKMQIPNIHSYVLIQLFLFQKKGNKNISHIPSSSNKRFEYCVGEKEMDRVVMECKVGDDWIS